MFKLPWKKDASDADKEENPSNKEKPSADDGQDQDEKPAKKSLFSFIPSFGKKKKDASSADAEEPAKTGDGEGDDSAPKKGGIAGIISGLLSKKLVIIIAGAVVLLIAAGGAYYFFFMKDKGESAAEEKEIESTIDRLSDYSLAFLPGEVKVIQDTGDKTAEPYFELSVNSAKELTAAEKSTYGLGKITDRLASVELDVKLVDTSNIWNMYNRRIADADGKWLDELMSVGDRFALDQGDVATETLIVRLLNEQAISNETISVFIYTASWNEKEKADAKCDVAVTPPPRQRPTPPPRVTDTEYGNWTGQDYSSAYLNTRLSLPEGWSNRSSAVLPGSGNTTLEASAIRSDNKAGLQIKIYKEPGNTNEDAHLTRITDVLAKAVGNDAVSSPANQTIAANMYRGVSYTLNDIYYQIYALVYEGKLIEIAIHFPAGEVTQAREFLNYLQPMQ